MPLLQLVAIFLLEEVAFLLYTLLILRSSQFCFEFKKKCNQVQKLVRPCPVNRPGSAGPDTTTPDKSIQLEVRSTILCNMKFRQFKCIFSYTLLASSSYIEYIELSRLMEAAHIDLIVPARNVNPTFQTNLPLI